MPDTTLFQINCGGGAEAPFEADSHYANGNPLNFGNAIGYGAGDVNTNGQTNPAPLNCYLRGRYCTQYLNFVYSFSSLNSAKSHKVRLHFFTPDTSDIGRAGNITINGVELLTNYNAFVAAGGARKVKIEEFTIAAGTTTISVDCFSTNSAFVLWAIELIELDSGGGGGSAPVANFNFSPSAPVAGQTVNFTDASQNTPTQWQWDFENNGSTDSTAQNPTHTYPSAGTYTCKLTAINEFGTNTITKQITVSPSGGGGGSAPVADFSFSPQNPVAGQSVQFTDASTNSPTSWAWDFQNNGSTDSTQQNPSFTYQAAGTYTVRLTAINQYGEDDVLKQITVSPSGGGGGDTTPPTITSFTAEWAESPTTEGDNWNTLSYDTLTTKNS